MRRGARLLLLLFLNAGRGNRRGGGNQARPPASPRRNPATHRRDSPRRGRSTPFSPGSSRYYSEPSSDRGRGRAISRDGHDTGCHASRSAPGAMPSFEAALEDRSFPPRAHTRRRALVLRGRRRREVGQAAYRYEAAKGHGAAQGRWRWRRRRRRRRSRGGGGEGDGSGIGSPRGAAGIRVGIRHERVERVFLGG